MSSREVLADLVGRPIPEGGHICLTRAERRDLSKELQKRGYSKAEPGSWVRVLAWNGEPIYVYGDESGHCNE